MSQSLPESLYTLLHELYKESYSPKDIFRDCNYQALLAQDISWKSLSDVIENINAADERLYLRSLVEVYRQDYIALHLNRLNLEQKINLPVLQECVFLFDLFWNPFLEFSQWMQKIDNAETSLRFRLSHQGFDIYQLMQQLSRQATTDEKEKTLQIILDAINEYFFHELRIITDARQFFDPSAHILHQVMDGNRNATSYSILLISLILFLRLQIPTYGLNFPRSSFLKIELGKDSFFIGVEKNLQILSTDELKIKFDELDIHTKYNYLETVSYRVLLKRKISHLQTLCLELTDHEKLKYLETLEQNIVS